MRESLFEARLRRVIMELAPLEALFEKVPKSTLKPLVVELKKLGASDDRVAQCLDQVRASVGRWILAVNSPLTDELAQTDGKTVARELDGVANGAEALLAAFAGLSVRSQLTLNQHLSPKRTASGSGVATRYFNADPIEVDDGSAAGRQSLPANMRAKLHRFLDDLEALAPELRAASQIMSRAGPRGDYAMNLMFRECCDAWFGAAGKWPVATEDDGAAKSPIPEAVRELVRSVTGQPAPKGMNDKRFLRALAQAKKSPSPFAATPPNLPPS